MRRNSSGLTFYNAARTFDGYTLFTPMNPSVATGQVWLIDMLEDELSNWSPRSTFAQR